jgi:hypothetical protein
MLIAMKKRSRWISVVTVLALLTGCYTVPETGRRSAIVISPGEEAEMGAAAFADVRAKEKVSADPAANERVQRVGREMGVRGFRRTEDGQRFCPTGWEGGRLHRITRSGLNR